MGERQPATDNCKQQRSCLVEDHSFVVVDEDAVIEVEANRLGEDRFLEVFAFANQIRHRVAVIDPSNVLVNDGAFVKISGCVVRRGAD